MNTKALKQKILDLAIHGKLVAQNPDDESASVLLEKIRAEKANLVAEKKMKADKKDSFIFVGDDDRHYEKFADGTVKDIEDDIPFELPEGWAWCRLHSISELLNGDRGENYPSKNDYVKQGIPFINAGCLDNGFIDFSLANYITEEKYNSLRAGKIQEGDILYCLRGSLGKTGIVINNSKGAISSSLCIFRLNKVIQPEFFLHVLNSSVILNQQSMVDNGTAQPNLSAKDVSNYFIPLPPLAEQERIVSAIENIFSQIDTLEQNKSDLQTAIKQAKSKILDLAIHGKLVAQDSNDEPAEELLKRIAARNSEDESPFEIPDSWKWCTGNDLFNPMTSKKPSGEKFRYIDIDAIDNKKHCVIQPKSIAVSEAPSRASRELNTGDVLFSLVRPYLENIALIEEQNSDCIASTGFYVCKPKEVLFPKFLFYLMTSEYVVKGLNQFMKGDNSPSINSNDIKNWLYPLPPLAEQKRIAWKIEAMFARLEAIADELAV